MQNPESKQTSLWDCTNKASETEPDIRRRAGSAVAERLAQQMRHRNSASLQQEGCGVHGAGKDHHENVEQPPLASEEEASTQTGGNPSDADQGCESGPTKVNSKRRETSRTDEGGIR